MSINCEELVCGTRAYSSNTRSLKFVPGLRYASFHVDVTVRSAAQLPFFTGVDTLLKFTPDSKVQPVAEPLHAPLSKLSKNSNVAPPSQALTADPSP